MRRSFLILIALLALPFAVQAQFTIVTGTVSDTNSLPYACGTISAQLIVPGGTAPTLNGGGFTTQTSPVQLGCPTIGGSGPIGNFTMRLADNNVISPAGTQWRFTVNASGVLPPLGTGPQACTATVTITGGSQSLTTNFSACPALTNLGTATGIGVGGGSVSTFSSGNLTPLFTTSVATPNTTPALSYTLSNAGANTVFGNCTGASAPPAYCSITSAMLPGSGVGSGTVTSVGLSLPPQFAVANTPVTSAGVLAGTLLPEPAFTVWAGPAQNSIGGILDGTIGTTGSSTSPSASVTPTTSHDLAFAIFQTSGGQTGAPTMPGGWISTVTNGNNAAIFRQVFSSSAAITAPVTLTNSALWSEILIALRLPAGSPTIVQTQFIGGAIGTSTLTFPGNVTNGNSILAVFCSPTNSGSPSVVYTDQAQNNYTQIGFAQNGANTTCVAGLTASISGGGTTDPVTATVVNTGGGGSFFWVAELSNLATPNGEPTFRPLTPQDLRGGASLATNQSFSIVTVNSDVAVSATTITAIASKSVTMPIAGCPCRVLASYSLYVNTATSGVGYNLWVTDGTNPFAQVSQGQSNGSSGALVTASYTELSPVTYANSANVTFTLNAFGDHTFTVKSQSPVSATLANGPVLSHLQLAIQTSN